MARKKRPDIVETHELRRFERHNHAETIATTYPDVRSITITVRFKDANGLCDPEAQTWTYSPAMKGFFEIRCPFWECALGGFNFGGAVAGTVKDRQRKASGEAKCSGWQDRERVNKHACMLKAFYEIDIAYEGN